MRWRGTSPWRTTCTRCSRRRRGTGRASAAGSGGSGDGGGASSSSRARGRTSRTRSSGRWRPRGRGRISPSRRPSGAGGSALKVLDTTILVDVLRNVPAAVEKLRALEAEGPIATTEIVAYELHHGIQHVGRRRRDAEAGRIEELLAQADVLPLHRRAPLP